jgi:hypothetical protein
MCPFLFATSCFKVVMLTPSKKCFLRQLICKARSRRDLSAWLIRVQLRPLCLCCKQLVSMRQGAPHWSLVSSSISLFWCFSGKARAWNIGAARWACSAVPAFVFQNEPSIRSLMMTASRACLRRIGFNTSSVAYPPTKLVVGMSVRSRFDSCEQSSLLRNLTLIRLDKYNRQKIDSEQIWSKTFVIPV